MFSIEKFRNLAKELSQNENVILLWYHEHTPISNDKINEIEEEIGFKIPKDILDFYQQTNGLRISWIHKQDPRFGEDYHIPLEKETLENLDAQYDFSPDYTTISRHESGCINILALEDIFTKPFEMNEDLITEGKYVFDAFSMIFGAAIYFPIDKNSPKIIFDSDYYCAFDDINKEMGFNEYLEFLVKTKGIKCFRTQKNEIDELFQVLDPELKNWPEEFYYYEY